MASPASRTSSLPMLLLAAACGCASPGVEGSPGFKAAQADLARGHLELRGYGRRSTDFDAAYARLLRERLGVTDNVAAGCVVTEELVRDTRAYNAAMTREIERRHGVGAFGRLGEKVQLSTEELNRHHDALRFERRPAS